MPARLQLAMVPRGGILAQIAPAPRILRVSLRNDFTRDGENNTFWHGNPNDYRGTEGARVWNGLRIGGAQVEIDGTGVSGDTEETVAAELDISAVGAGAHILRITAEHTSREPVGPAIDPGDPPVERIYRPVEVFIHLNEEGNLTDATVRPVRLTDGSVDRPPVHAKIGHRELRNWTADGSPRHLPIDMKPIWINSRRRGGAITPTLIVVHHTGRLPAATNWGIGNGLNALAAPGGGRVATTSSGLTGRSSRSTPTHTAATTREIE